MGWSVPLSLLLGEASLLPVFLSHNPGGCWARGDLVSFTPRPIAGPDYLSVGPRRQSRPFLGSYCTMRISGKKDGLGSCFGEFGGGSSGQREIVWVVLITPSCPTLCNPVDCSPLDSSVCGIVQARILEWITIPFSRGSSQTRDRTPISCRHILHCLSPQGSPRPSTLREAPFLRVSHPFNQSSLHTPSSGCQDYQ